MHKTKAGSSGNGHPATQIEHIQAVVVNAEVLQRTCPIFNRTKVGSVACCGAGAAIGNACSVAGKRNVGEAWRGLVPQRNILMAQGCNGLQ